MMDLVKEEIWEKLRIELCNKRGYEREHVKFKLLTVVISLHMSYKYHINRPQLRFWVFSETTTKPPFT
jgi:hypothetical protein